MKTLKEIIIGVLIGLIIAQPLAAMAETREQYIDHTKNTYNPAAGQRATNLQGTVQNKIVNTWAGRNPEVFMVVIP